MKTNVRSTELTKILEGLEKVYDKLIEFKKKNNSVLVVYREGKILKIKP